MWIHSMFISSTAKIFSVWILLSCCNALAIKLGVLNCENKYAVSDDMQSKCALDSKKLPFNNNGGRATGCKLFPASEGDI